MIGKPQSFRSHARPAARRLLGRVITYFVCDLPSLPNHFRIVGNLLARDSVSPIFSERERTLLLTIAGTDRPPRRHRWALRELSRRVAIADMPADRRRLDA